MILLVHSRLFMPASWTFPLWQKDYGAILADKDENIYKGITDDDNKAKEWSLILSLLLICREALWRYLSGDGSAKRVTKVIEKVIEKESPNKYPHSKDKLISLRLVSEYLDVISTGNVSNELAIKGLSKLWNEFKNPDQIPKKLSESKTKRETKLFDSFPIKNSEGLSHLEMVGFDKIKTICHHAGVLDNFYTLVDILLDRVKKIKNSHMVWIHFDTVEIIKRKELFLKTLKDRSKNQAVKKKCEENLKRWTELTFP
jgi:hypothetical protein